MEKTIVINNHDEEIAILEKIHYECQARENIINFMVLNKMMKDEDFNDYWEQYIAYLKTYTDLKDEFYYNVIVPCLNQDDHFKHWELHFREKEVTMYDKV